MSRRSDDDGDGEEQGGERPRRRRRAGGLRIPSDNVPRHSGSQPVVAPVPEDPGLAVSIAYAFGDDASGPRPRLEDESGDDTTAIGARPEAPPTFPSLDDIVPDGRTRQMPAISLEALGLSAEDDPGAITHVGPPAAPPAPEPVPDGVDVVIDDDDTGNQLAPAPPGSPPGPAMVTVPVPRIAMPADGASRDGAGGGSDSDVAVVSAPAIRRILPSMPPGATALSEDDLEEVVDPGAGPIASPRGGRRHPATVPMRSGGSDGAAGVAGERTTTPMPVVSPSEALPSVIVTFSPTGTSQVMTPAMPSIPPVPPVPPIAPGSPSSPGASPAVSPTILPAIAATSIPIPPTPTMVGPAPAPMPPPMPESPISASDSLSDGWTLPVPDGLGEAEPVGLGPADAVLEDVAEPVPTAADPSDSGEILAAELVDDEEHARAAPVTTIAPAPTAPNAPPVPP
ncbi:MAG TPA: hypothetical protein VHE35_32230, partial [Kofleriaceae bacterium]|nr:hypothetical protein [Kofleriaceae bacterium]